MEEAGVCGKVTIYGGKASNTTCLFVLDIILLVYILTKMLEERWYICEETAVKQRGKY